MVKMLGDNFTISLHWAVTAINVILKICSSGAFIWNIQGVYEFVENII